MNQEPRPAALGDSPPLAAVTGLQDWIAAAFGIRPADREGVHLAEQVFDDL